MKKLAPGGAYKPTHGVFFQAPVGEVEDEVANGVLDQALNTWGFFLEIADGREFVPDFLGDSQPSRWRSRLLELRQPTERLGIYPTTKPSNPHLWFLEPIYAKSSRPVRVLAENVVALVILPRLARQDELARPGKPVLCPQYDYDSTRASNHTPPIKPPDPEINPKNQLPPVVQVVMVAIDDVSARRLAAEHAEQKDLGIKTDGLFEKSNLLEDNPATPEPGDGDLASLERQLVALRANYRTFSTNVAIRGAKWSKADLDL
jgi:uncharacterized protein (TIGR02599 family)